MYRDYLLRSFRNELLLFPLVTLILICSIFFIPSRYEENDDVIMSWIASGFISGEPSMFLIFSNIIIGYVLKFFYQVSPETPWYSLYLYFFHWFALTIFVIYSRNFLPEKLRFSFWASVIFLEYYFLTNLQFTTTAGMVGIAGVILLVKSSNTDYWFRVLSLIALASSFMIRKEAFYLIIGLSGFFLLQKVWKNWGGVKFTILTFMVILCLWGIDKYHYTSDPDLNGFVKYNQIRGELEHKIMNNYAFNPKIWTLEELNLYRSFYLESPEKYSLKELQYENDNAPKFSIDYKSRLIELVRHFCSSKFRIILAFWILFLTGWIIWKQGSSILLNLIPSIVLTFYVSLFMIMKDRVLYVILFFALLVLVCSIKQHNFIILKVLPALLILSVLYAYIKSAAINRDINLEIHKSMEFLISYDPSKIVHLWPSDPDIENIRPIQNKYSWKNKNNLYIMGWLSNSPFNTKILRHRQSDTFYQSLSEGKGVLAVNPVKRKKVLKDLIVHFDNLYGGTHHLKEVRKFFTKTDTIQMLQLVRNP